MAKKKRKRPEGIYTGPESQGASMGKRMAGAIIGTHGIIPGGKRIGGRNAYMGITGYQAARAALRSNDPQEQKMGRQILGSMAVGGAAGALLSHDRKEGAKWGGTIGAMVGGRVAKKKYNRSLEEYALGLIALGEEIISRGFKEKELMYGGKNQDLAFRRRVGGAMLGGSGATLATGATPTPITALGASLGWGVASRAQARNAMDNSKNKREREAAGQVLRGHNVGTAVGGLGGAAAGYHGARTAGKLLGKKWGTALMAPAILGNALVGSTVAGNIGGAVAGHKTGFGQKKLKNWKKK